MIGAIRKTWVENFIGRRTEKRNLNNEKSRCRRRCMLDTGYELQKPFPHRFILFIDLIYFIIYMYIFLYIHIGLERIPPIG